MSSHEGRASQELETTKSGALGLGKGVRIEGMQRLISIMILNCSREDFVHWSVITRCNESSESNTYISILKCSIDTVAGQVGSSM